MKLTGAALKAFNKLDAKDVESGAQLLVPTNKAQNHIARGAHAIELQDGDFGAAVDILTTGPHGKVLATTNSKGNF